MNEAHFKQEVNVRKATIKEINEPFFFSPFSNHKLYLLFGIFTIKGVFPILDVHMIFINDSEKMWVVSFT